MAALICIKVIHVTFWQLFNIANRFLLVFVSLVVPIKNIFPGVHDLSVVCNVRAPYSRRLKFSAIFLCRLVPWLSVDIQVKFYGDRPRGTPPSGELNIRGVAKYSDFGPIERYISAKFVLITNRKSHMRFRLVANSVTLDDLERRNSPNRRVISPNSVAFGTDYVKVVEDTTLLSAAEM